MGSTRETAEAKASREATDWLILLLEDPADPHMQADFAAWRAASPLHATAWAHTQHASGLIEAAAPQTSSAWRAPVDAPHATSDHAAPSARRPARRPIIHERRRLAVGLVGAAMLAAGLAMALPGLLLRWQADYMTGTAETRRVVLADGSTLLLAPQSAIAVDFAGSRRHITLLRGEAYFVVRHDVARPFMVNSRGIETTDIGTAFDMRRGEVGVAIAVEEGQVRVDYAAASPPLREALGAGETLDVSWGGTAHRGAQPPASIAAWRQRQVIALDQPLREVVARVRPYFSGEVILTDTTLGARPVTGVYNLADPLEALRGIARAQGARLRQITPWIVVISRN